MRNLLSNKKSVILIAALTGFFALNLYSQEGNLLQTIRDNDFTAAKALIASGADVNQEDELTNLTPILLAMGKNNIDMVKILIKSGADINKQDKRSGYTPLMMAFNNHNNEMAKLLLDAGADVNIKANDGTTAIILAAGNSRELFDVILSKGADMNVRTDRGTGVYTQCILGIMSDKVDTDFAKYLISKGADRDEQNTFGSYSGYTPLFWAILYDEEDVVKFLVESGSRTDIVAKNGKTALSLAKENGNENIVKILEHSK
ncbi:MAG: ankyrin repeat domain-containing protein [Bacteroidales bacterium]|nr:ankyrin repeat domain-containing protein [Bacteroidales bacterium]MCF8389986.1 ankyrin repeat domain-containing protein [Bacteroidales bacterium]